MVTDVVADAPGSYVSLDLVRRAMKVLPGSNGESLIVSVFLGVELIDIIGNTMHSLMFVNGKLS